MTTVVFNSSGTFNNPAGVVSLDCAAWGEGGNGAAGLAGGSSHSGGGGGGGEYAEETTLAVTAGSNYTYTIGAGGSGTNTSFPGDAVTVTAHAGASSGSTTGASGGTGSTNSIKFAGGAGGSGTVGSNRGGGGGGSSAGTGSVGGNGTSNSGGTTGGAGGTAPSGGGNGGNGAASTVAGGGNGTIPGGAGGGGSTHTGTNGGSGAAGQITLTYTATANQTASLSGVGTLTAAGGPLLAASLTGVGTLTAQVSGRQFAALTGVGTLTPHATLRSSAALTGTGTLTAFGAAPAPAVVNQWASGYFQGGAFDNTNPVLQSVAIPLDPAFSVGTGSGVTTPGNWLFAIASWTQDPAVATAHIGAGDDVHSWWREYPASNIGGMTRTSVSYTPNIARQVSNVYVAPDDEVSAINVLVVEISGLGPWDTLAGTAVASAQAGNYDAAVRAASPQAWWKLADTAGSTTAADSSGNGHPGTPSSVTFGNASQAVPGNTSASFPSASSAHILTGYNPALYQGVTVEAWVNLNSLSQSGNPRILANSHTDVDDAGFELMLSGTTPQVWFGNGTLTNHVTAGSPLASTGWTHLAGTWDGTTVTLYVNGVSQGTAALAGDMPAGTASGTGIGYNPAYSGDYINGLLAECAVYSGALTAAQVLAHYQCATGAASTSITLAHAAGAQASFWIAGIGGDNVSSSQAFAPSGWTTLATQTQTNGTDHTTDNILTSAFIPNTSGSISVSGTASSENLSGFLLGVYVVGTSPVPAVHNPNWPYLLFEAAFGSGFNDPNSELTWTDISSRLWSYDETTGIQFQLGQLQATNLELELDNFDGALSSLNTASPYYPGVLSGVPLRIRAAIGTIAGVTANRWYVIQRNAQEWPEAIDEAFRRNAPATGTDVWAALSSTGPTPYRGEVYADSPYAWWPCDDQPQSGGVLPTFLLNAALGNTNPLNILISPLGAVAQIASPGGAPANQFAPANSATYSVGADSGWMFGDPQSTPASALAGNQITASPGSAAWQQANLLGTTGSQGWFLSCNDASFPPLSGGITVEGWFNYTFAGSAAGYTSNFSASAVNYSAQPTSPMTLIELATGSNPVAVLQLDSSGHLSLTTYNGGTGTSHSVYSSSDLRSEGWFGVTMTLTTTTWTVLLDGGDLATASGSASGMTSAWTWLLANADMGSGGGGQTAGIAHGANVAISHLAVYPYILPNWRIQAHYWAAVTGFGLIPAPQSPAVAGTVNSSLDVENLTISYTADGAAFIGSYGTSGASVLAAEIVANAGGFTSGPSAWGQASLTGQFNSGRDVINGAAGYVSWTGLATTFSVYTSNQVNAGTQAAVSQGQSVTFTAGYGAGASATGPGVVAGGSGGAPPSAASAIGDTVANRIERALGYANVNYPGRCIDAAPDLVQAGLDLGGQQAGQNVQNIAISDGGLLFIDNVGKLNYWQRPHLAAQYSSPVWQIGPTTSAGRTPYDREIKWILDPQQAYNAIEIQPYSPTGAALPIITPSNGTEVIASQQQYGAQPYSVNSYLQQTSEMQAQANWLFTNFGQPQRRVENVKIDAATYPQAWTLVLGINVGDLLQLEDWQIGGGGTVYTYRVSEIKRKFAFGDDRNLTEASVTLQVSPEPTSYWT